MLPDNSRTSGYNLTFHVCLGTFCLVTMRGSKCKANKIHLTKSCVTYIDFYFIPLKTNTTIKKKRNNNKHCGPQYIFIPDHKEHVEQFKK